MTFKIVNFIALLVYLLTVASGEVFKNDQGVVHFETLGGPSIQLPNRHRTNGGTKQMKLSFHNGVVDRVTKRNNTAWNIHLNDNSDVELSINDISGTVTEYYLYWKGGAGNNGREVCLHHGYNGASWYNAYQSMNASFPMSSFSAEPRQPFNYLFDYDRFNTHTKDHEFVMVLEHLFLGSDGFAALLDQNAPLFVRRVPNSGDPWVCFAVDNAYPYREADHEAAYLDIKIHFYASTNIRTVTDYIVHQSGKLPKPNNTPDERLFSAPIWFLWEMNRFEFEYAVEQFINETTHYGFDKLSQRSPGLISLDFWESDYGNYTFAPKRYPHPETMLNDLKKQNFVVAAPIYGPFLNDPNKDDQNKYFVKDSKGKVSNVVDFSNPDASRFYTDQMRKHFDPLKQIDILHLFPHFSLPKDHKLHDPLVEQAPSQLTTKYLEAVSQVGRQVITEFAFKTQHLPVMTRLTNQYREPYDQDLKELVFDALSVSVAGYSFLIPYSAGGFFTGFYPSDEMFIRMTQAQVFMPAMSFTRKPWDYAQKTMDIVKKCIQLHSEHSNTIIDLAKRRVREGTPIVRPLWYVSPDDPKTYTVGDQYMLGDDILVAPVLKIGQFERTVYFPAGTWVDQHGKTYNGPSEAKVAAPLEELPYFKKR